MAAKGTFVLRGDQKYQLAFSKEFNIDNGSGTADDDVLLAALPYDIIIESVKAVYTEATDTTGAAAATISLGTTAGGVDIVAATALAAAKAVGSTTSYTVVASRLAAGSALFARHTGVASTEAGKYRVQVVYYIMP